MTRDDETSPLLDALGQPFFRCQACTLPFCAADFYDLGLRLPDPTMSSDDYCTEELLDSEELRHLHCLGHQKQHALVM